MKAEIQQIPSLKLLLLLLLLLLVVAMMMVLQLPQPSSAAWSCSVAFPLPIGRDLTASEASCPWSPSQLCVQFAS